jgi:NagD protein
MGFAIDLDGVVWLGGEPIAGAVEAIGRLRANGLPLAFVTNHSQHTQATIGARLEKIGIDPKGDVISSAMAVAHLVMPGDRVFALAGPGVLEALEQRQAVVVDTDQAVDVVVVGRHEDLSWDRLSTAVRAVHRGARLVATNTDPSYPTARGLEPGTGALVAAVEVAAGRRVDAVAGKPHPAMAELVRRHLGSSGWVIGDLPSTDGLLARVLGWRFALVLSGVTTGPDGSLTPPADLVTADLSEAVEVILSSTPGGAGVE